MPKTDKNILFLQQKVAYVRDEAAYKELFFFFHPPLYRFVFNIIKKEDASEDIVSDLMIKLWQMETKLAYIENLNVYLFKSAKNASLTFLKAQKNNLLPLSEIDEELISDTSRSITDKINFSETALAIETAVKLLPPNCQMIFRLIKEEGLSYRQVSEVLEISQNTIETQMRIALKRIRSSLDSYLQKK